MAHTISKQIYSEEQKKYIECEVLVFDEEEDLPETDRREIILSCSSHIIDSSDNESSTEIEDSYQETQLIDQYEDLSTDKNT